MPSFTNFFEEKKTARSDRSSISDSVSEESFCEDTWTIVDEETPGQIILPMTEDTPTGLFPFASQSEEDISSRKIQQCDSGMSLMEAYQIQNKLVDYNKKVFSYKYNEEFRANLINLKNMGFLDF